MSKNQLNEQMSMIKNIQRICKQILQTQTDEFSSIRKTIQQWRDENKQFLKDLQAISKSWKYIDQFRNDIEQIDVQLKRLDQQLKNVQHQNQKKSLNNLQGIQYVTGFLLQSISQIWKKVKSVINYVIQKISNGHYTLFKDTEVILKQNQRQLIKLKTHNQNGLNKQIKAYRRLEERIVGYIEKKGKKYLKNLQNVQESLQKLKKSSISSNKSN